METFWHCIFKFEAKFDPLNSLKTELMETLSQLVGSFQLIKTRPDVIQHANTSCRVPLRLKDKFVSIRCDFLIFLGIAFLIKFNLIDI